MPGRAKHHDELARLMAKHKGCMFTAGEVKEFFEKEYPPDEYPHLRVDFVQASDHCIDHICKEACDCAKTDKAIFRRPAWNTYIVL